MAQGKYFREFLIMSIMLLAILHASKSIFGSVEHQFYLHQQSVALKAQLDQAQQVNKELREGLNNYRSSSGIEKLARERLNLAGADEVVVRIGK